MKYPKSHLLRKQTGAGALIDIDPNKRAVKFYGSIFDKIDSDGDYFERSAWDKTIQEQGPSGRNRVKWLRNHSMDHPVSKFKALYTDEKGLIAEAEIQQELMSIDYIKDLFILMDAGVIDEFSVGARLIKGEYNQDKQAYGIKEASLFEISAVTLAAQEDAVLIDLKSLSTDKIEHTLKQMSKAETLLRKGNLTDETCKELEYMVLSWKNLFNSHKPNDDSLVPDAEQKQLMEIINELKSF